MSRLGGVGVLVGARAGHVGMHELGELSVLGGLVGFGVVGVVGWAVGSDE